MRTKPFARSLVRSVFAVAALTAIVVAAPACKDRAAEKKKAEDAERAMLENEAKVRAESEAKEAQTAIADATAACDKGEAAGCVKLGRLHHDGRGMPRDMEKAKGFYTTGCAKGAKDGCRYAADLESDAEKKLQHLVALCDLKDATGCLEGAQLSDQLAAAGKQAPPKKGEERLALSMLKKSCDLGGSIACTARGVALAADQPKDAVEAFTKGCDGGEPTSCWQLGNMLAEGKGAKKDPAKAAELKKKACDAGLKDAC